VQPEITVSHRRGGEGHAEGVLRAWLGRRRGPGQASRYSGNGTNGLSRLATQARGATDRRIPRSRLRRLCARTPTWLPEDDRVSTVWGAVRDRLIPFHAREGHATPRPRECPAGPSSSLRPYTRAFRRPSPARAREATAHRVRRRMRLRPDAYCGERLRGRRPGVSDVGVELSACQPPTWMPSH
jgi:hypothetical protein